MTMMMKNDYLNDDCDDLDDGCDEDDVQDEWWGGS